jgi:transposase
MVKLEDIINHSTDPREMKRALAVKMVILRFVTDDICLLLEVSDSFVSKWKHRYEEHGANGLLLGYQGSQGLLTETERKEVIAYLNIHRLSLEALRDYLEEQYEVSYKSKQSYYELFDAAKISWHKSEKVNPQKVPEQVLQTRADLKKKLHEREAEIATGAVSVFLEDECHLVWGDTLGYAWGRRNLPITVPMSNERERQTYYGAFDLYQKEFILRPAPCADGENTVTFVKYLEHLRPGKKLLLIWDKASYHRYADMKAYLEEVNKGLAEKDWRVTCLLFASAAPEQNPVEDIWLKGKNFLRRHFYQNKTFHQVKESFFHFLNHHLFDFHKLTWYI